MNQYSTEAMLAATLLIWGIAMSAATWTRFKHVGQQLTWPTSLLLAGGIWLAIFMILAIGDSYASNAAAAGIFLVALACYSILRMNGRNQEKEVTPNNATTQTSSNGFENGMLLSVSLGVFIFASQFSSLNPVGNDAKIDAPSASSQLPGDDIEDILNAADKRRAAQEFAEESEGTALLPSAETPGPIALRLEDGWNISLFHYDQNSNTVKIEAVTAEQSATDTTDEGNTLKAAPNNWHQISNVKVVSYPADTPATWIEVELSQADVNTLRFAAETGAISIYSE
jgi:hypothetical protein